MTGDTSVVVLTVTNVVESQYFLARWWTPSVHPRSKRSGFKLLMQQLVILVVAAAWVAVLIPPMLRSRLDNRPNSSVTDFRRQLNRLQTTAPPRGGVRYMGRQLAQSSPLQRQAAGGRPGHGPARQASLQRQAPAHRSGGGRGGVATAHRPAQRIAEQAPDAGRYRSHGDPTSPQRRPARDHSNSFDRRPVERRPAERRPAQGRQRPAHAADPTVVVKRRRTNILFMLVVATACTMFLAFTTDSGAMQAVFAVSFLGLCGYVYLLAQLREREDTSYNNGWLEQH